MGGLRVGVIGSGNWGTAVARIVGMNAARHDEFTDQVLVWAHQGDSYGARTVKQMINEDHENVKYLPGFPIPINVKATDSKEEVLRHSDLLVFVLPHQFVSAFLSDVSAEWVRPNEQRAVSLIKGLDVDEATGRPKVFSQLISEKLGFPCCALSGANVALDIAKEQFAEATLGYTHEADALMWQKLFHRPAFRISAIPDPYGVQICGALKNVIALAAGFCDGLGLGSNTKAAAIRLGIKEMRKFALIFFDGVLEETLLESAGVADVVTTCYGGRNVRCAAEFVKRGGGAASLWGVIEAELLNGQKLQGHLTCIEVHEVLQRHGILEEFPLFEAVYQIAHLGAPAGDALLASFVSDEPPKVRRVEECVEPRPRAGWYGRCRALVRGGGGGGV